MKYPEKIWLDRHGRVFDADDGHSEWAADRAGVTYNPNRATSYYDILKRDGWVDVEVSDGKIYVRYQWTKLNPAQRRVIMNMADDRHMPVVDEWLTLGGGSRQVYPEVAEARQIIEDVRDDFERLADEFDPVATGKKLVARSIIENPELWAVNPETKLRKWGDEITDAIWQSSGLNDNDWETYEAVADAVFTELDRRHVPDDFWFLRDQTTEALEDDFERLADRATDSRRLARLIFNRALKDHPKWFTCTDDDPDAAYIWVWVENAIDNITTTYKTAVGINDSDVLGELEWLVSQEIRNNLEEAVTFGPNGIGAVPLNRDVNYFGFVREMTPQEFRALVPPGVSGSKSAAYIAQAIAKDEPLGNPWLQVKWLPDEKAWQVTNHEGRSRSDAIRAVDPTFKIPVHIFPVGLRARHLTPEMRVAPLLPQVYEAQLQPGEPGRCFNNARKWAMDHDEPGTKVVHGTVFFIRTGRRGDHAWVEQGDEVIDPTTGVRMPRQRWYDLMQAKPDAAYAPEVATINMARTGHQGPWRPDELKDIPQVERGRRAAESIEDELERDLDTLADLGRIPSHEIDRTITWDTQAALDRWKRFLGHRTSIISGHYESPGRRGDFIRYEYAAAGHVVGFDIWLCHQSRLVLALVVNNRTVLELPDHVKPDSANFDSYFGLSGLLANRNMIDGVTAYLNKLLGVGESQEPVKPVSDYTRYVQVHDQLVAMLNQHRADPPQKILGSPEYRRVWAELEQIKNRHGGMPPPPP